MKKKQKTSVKTNTEPVLPHNEYYERVSEKLGILQVVLYLSLLAFVVLSFLGNTDMITYEKFYYFVKDLNASAETVDVWNTDSVSYPTDDVQSFTLYREGLAVAGKSNVTVFTATGRLTVSKTVTYTNPVAVGDGKYLLVYDHGGRQYSLYNSYTQIHAGETEYPISGAAVSPNGSYALTTSSADYTSVVSLYDSNFSILNRYKKNGYVMDVAINSKGDTVSLVTSSVKEGQFQTELMICRAQETTALATLKIADSLALSCTFTENDIVQILCSGGTYTYTENGQLVNSQDFLGDTVTCFAESEEGYAVVLKTAGTSEKKQTLVLDSRGNVMYNGQATKQIDAVSRYDSTVYLQTAYGILRLDADSGSYEEQLCNTEQKYLLAVNDDEFLLCSPKKATYMSFD
ncbi:MAG: hypothetical protein IJW16_07790 [Clostridia bacterium]|nr:hypothetical protein [Clostridia bacterium]